MHYPGRRLPLAVKFGQPGEPAPPFVSRVWKGGIHIEGELPPGTVGAAVLVYVDTGNRLDLNDELRRNMSALCQIGMAFADNHREQDSPASLMRFWQEAGKLAHSFAEVGWLSPGRWQITTVPVPEPGVRGWQPQADDEC